MSTHEYDDYQSYHGQNFAQLTEKGLTEIITNTVSFFLCVRKYFLIKPTYNNQKWMVNISF